MAVEDELNAFKMWAAKIGCPIDCLPSDEALNSIFRSRHSSLFFNIMERIRPTEEIEFIRKKIFVEKMEKFSGKKIEKCERSFAPREYQRFCEIKDLEKEKKNIEKRILEAKEKVNQNQDAIKTQMLQKQHLSHTLDNLNVKCYILELKNEDLDKRICEEKSLQEKILNLMPAKLSTSNKTEEDASKAIAEAFKELDSFYSAYATSSSSDYIEEAKQDLWTKMRNLLSKIPNSLLWNVLNNLKDEQLQKIKNLNNLSDRNGNELHDIDDLDEFNLELIKTKSTVISLASKCLALKQEEIVLNERFTENYDEFCDEVQLKIQSFNTDNNPDLDEVISDYIVQYNTYSYNQGRKEYLIAEIERCKKIIDENNKSLEDHEVLMGSLKQLYNEIDVAVKRTQNDIMQLGEIRDKIKFSRNVLQELIIDNQRKNQFANKTKMNLSDENSRMNMSMASVSTLKLSPPGPGLCSTKLDMDITNTTFMGNKTFRGGNSTLIFNQNENANILPQHSLELETFIRIPIRKFKIMPKECQLSISSSPLYYESSEPVETLKDFPGYLLRPELAISKFKSKLQWCKELKELSTELNVKFQPPEFVEEDIQKKRNEQTEEITFLIDEIEEISKNSERSLNKSKRYYDFLLENPLRKFIPSSKLVNNQTYADYESEYSMYYRMISSSSNKI